MAGKSLVLIQSRSGELTDSEREYQSLKEEMTRLRLEAKREDLKSELAAFHSQIARDQTRRYRDQDGGPSEMPIAQQNSGALAATSSFGGNKGKKQNILEYV